MFSFVGLGNIAGNVCDENRSSTNPQRSISATNFSLLSFLQTAQAASSLSLNQNPKLCFFCSIVNGLRISAFSHFCLNSFADVFSRRASFSFPALHLTST